MVAMTGGAMQANLADFIRGTAEGDVAEEMLNRCVHCGICNAVCPTYRMTEDELEGPRGRIYQIKQVLEGTAAPVSVQRHLDHCLTCLACETVCPTKVEYGRLLDVGRMVVDGQVRRPWGERAARGAARRILTDKAVFSPLYRLARAARFALPGRLKGLVLQGGDAGPMPENEHPRQVLMLEGCVQPAAAPDINAAAARILDRLGIQVIYSKFAGCCGSLNLHSGARGDGLDDMRRNIDAWIPWLPDGIEAVVTTASGCGVTVKDYAYYLRNDARYAEKAARISALAKDIVEVLAAEAGRLGGLLGDLPSEKVVYHPPCTLQHGQKLKGSVEALFAGLGMKVWLPADSHACCGGAGAYMLFEPEWSERLKEDKLASIRALEPDVVLSANLGCMMRLAEGCPVPVRHWVEYLDDMLSGLGGCK